MNYLYPKRGSIAIPSIAIATPVGAAPPVDEEVEVELPFAALAAVVFDPLAPVPVTEGVELGFESPPRVVACLQRQVSKTRQSHEKKVKDKATHPVTTAVAPVALPVIAPGPWLPLAVKYKLTAVSLGN